MSLTTTEALSLAQDVQALGQEVLEARSAESESGKRLSQAERRRIALSACKLALKLIIDVLD